MRGLQGRTTKLWDEMITTLSREDRAAWERIRREGDAFAVIGDDFWARTEVQGLIARGEGLPPEELEKVAGEFKRRFAGLAVETMVARFRTRLAESDMSAAGREGPEPEFASWAAICDGMKWPPAGSRLLTSRFGASSRHFSLLQKRILSMKRHRDEHDLGERWSWTHDEFDLLRNRTDSGPITT